LDDLNSGKSKPQKSKKKEEKIFIFTKIEKNKKK